MRASTTLNAIFGTLTNGKVVLRQKSVAVKVKITPTLL